MSAIVYKPLSIEQEHIWNSIRLAGSTAAVHQLCSAWIDGAVDTSILTAAIRIIIQRHHALRVALIEKNGQPQQVIMPDITFAPDELDLRAEAAGERDRSSWTTRRSSAYLCHALTRIGISWS